MGLSERGTTDKVNGDGGQGWQNEVEERKHHVVPDV